MAQISKVFVTISKVNTALIFFDIKVLELTNGEKIYDAVKIKEYNYGYVSCVTKLTPEFNEFKNEDLLYSITVKKLVQNEDESRFPYLNLGKILLLPQIISTNIFDLSQGYINFESSGAEHLMRSLSIGGSNDIYIECDNYLYGPLKIQNNKLIPKKGKEISEIFINKEEIIDVKDKKYYVGKFGSIIREIDAMSNGQIVEFFKDTFAKTTQYQEAFNNVKEIVLAADPLGNGLSEIRMQRMINIIGQIELVQDEIKSVISNSEPWSIIFNELYKEHKQSFDEQFIKTSDEEIKQIEKQKLTLSKEIELLVKAKEKSESELKSVNDELIVLKDQRETIINIIRIQAGIAQESKMGNNEREYFFELIEHCSVGKPKLMKNKLDQFLTQSDNIENDREVLNDFLSIIRNSKIIYSRDLQKFRKSIRILDSYQMLIQQVEIDWIKYDQLYHNGLEIIVKNAIEAPEKLHFLYLQDYNVAAIELFAKPLIDVVRKKRILVPGTNYGFPDNLRIVLGISDCLESKELFEEKSSLLEKIADEINLDNLKFLRSILDEENHIPLALNEVL